jgi:hypothetical protein
VLVLAVGVGVVLYGWVRGLPGAPFDRGPVVVLGGAGPRFQGGLEIVDLDAGDRELVLSSSAGILYERAGGDCGQPSVRCVMPDPETTYGEAQLIGRLAREWDWPSVTVVTIRSHRPRTQLLFDRCVDVPVTVVTVPDPDADGWGRARAVLREVAATAISFVSYRC